MNLVIDYRNKELITHYVNRAMQGHYRFKYFAACTKVVYGQPDSN